CGTFWSATDETCKTHPRATASLPSRPSVAIILDSQPRFSSIRVGVDECFATRVPSGTRVVKACARNGRPRSPPQTPNGERKHCRKKRGGGFDDEKVVRCVAVCVVSALARGAAGARFGASAGRRGAPVEGRGRCRRGA